MTKRTEKLRLDAFPHYF